MWSADGAAALDTFLEHARAMAAWYESRFNAVERQAAPCLDSPAWDSNPYVARHR
jgi:hypothetical protein